MSNNTCNTRIRSLYNTFSKKEKTIADYILKNPELITKMPINQLAEELQVGKASIIRFCNKLDFNGYKDLKIILARETPAEKKLIYTNTSNSQENLIDEVTAENMATLQISRQKLVTSDLISAVDLLISAEKLLILASGFSALLGEIAKYKIMKLGLNCELCSDYQFQCFSVANLPASGVILLIDLSGRLGELKPLITLAKSRNIKIIAIVNYEKSEITDIADIIILTEATESPLKDGEITTMLSQLNIVDVLYTMMAQKDNEAQVKRIELFEELIINQQSKK